MFVIYDDDVIELLQFVIHGVTMYVIHDVIGLLLFLLCSHSPDDVPPEPHWNVSIATVRDAVCPSNTCLPVSPAAEGHFCWLPTWKGST